MPINSFSVGRDLTLNITTPSGPLNINLITAFTSKPDLTDKKIVGLDGLVRHVRFHEGWSGSFDLDRQDSVLDDYWATLETNYYQGVNEQTATITETVTEASGAVTQYRLEGVLLKLDDAGDWKGNDTVKLKVGFVASRRIKVA